MIERETEHTAPARLPRWGRWMIHLPTILGFVWLFESGWINLWNKRSLPSPITGRDAVEWGGGSLLSVFIAIVVGYLFSWGLIWEIELLIRRRRLRPTQPRDR